MIADGSRIFHSTGGFTDEEVAVHGNADFPDTEGVGGRGSGAGAVSQIRHEQREFLQVACEVRRHGRLEHETAEGAPGRERALEEDVRRGEAQGRVANVPIHVYESDLRRLDILCLMDCKWSEPSRGARGFDDGSLP